MVQSIDAIIGRNLTALRHEHSLSQDDVAGAARLFGLRWNSARVSRMERGDSSMSVETLLVLCVVMGELTRGAVNPVDLVQTESAVRLAPSATLPPEGLDHLMRSDWFGPVSFFTEESQSRASEQSQELLDLWAAYDAIIESSPVPMTELDALLEQRRHWSLTDERNARKLDLTDAQFLVWCYHLWGRLMSQETDLRAPEGATAQKRGRITRELLDELRQRIAEAGKHGDD